MMLHQNLGFFKYMAAKKILASRKGATEGGEFRRARTFRRSKVETVRFAQSV